MSRPPLHALQGFVAAARAGNLSRAADSMHLTVSALSKQIRLLEERLTLRLFERGPRGVRLTADGSRLLERIAPHLDMLEQAVRPFAARHDDVLTLSVLPSIASAWLVPRLGAFVERHPEVQINLMSDVAVVDFARDTGVDAALRGGRGVWEGVVAEHLFDEWLAPVASPALIARMHKADPKRLEQWPLLGDPDHAWELWFAEHGNNAVPSRFVATFDDSETLHRAAAASVGVALGRLSRVRLLLESGQLLRLGTKRVKTDFAHYLVFPPRARTHRALGAFRAWLHDEAKRYADELLSGREANVPRSGRRKPAARRARG
jgi:LysR family transcriptional regulator, glycine cleavage system transcriptional activator